MRKGPHRSCDLFLRPLRHKASILGEYSAFTPRKSIFAPLCDSTRSPALLQASHSDGSEIATSAQPHGKRRWADNRANSLAESPSASARSPQYRSTTRKTLRTTTRTVVPARRAHPKSGVRTSFPIPVGLRSRRRARLCLRQRQATLGSAERYERQDSNLSRAGRAPKGRPSLSLNHEVGLGPLDEPYRSARKLKKEHLSPFGRAPVRHTRTGTPVDGNPTVAKVPGGWRPEARERDLSRVDRPFGERHHGVLRLVESV